MFQTIFLQAPGGGLSGYFFPFLLMLIVSIFFIWMPRKQQKEKEKLKEGLREGTEVYLTSGIIGKITKIDGNSVKLLIDEKISIRVLKEAIAGEFKG